MRRRFLTLLLAAAMLPSAAGAHGPTRKKITETVTIAAPALKQKVEGAAS